MVVTKPLFTPKDESDFLDRAALAILNGMISSPPIVDRETVDKPKWSQIAYEWADALLAERTRRLAAEKAATA